MKLVRYTPIVSLVNGKQRVVIGLIDVDERVTTIVDCCNPN